ncbi:MAG: hypothetical protein ACRDFA_11650, partial [bacterium]
VLERYNIVSDGDLVEAARKLTNYFQPRLNAGNPLTLARPSVQSQRGIRIFDFQHECHAVSFLRDWGGVVIARSIVPAPPHLIPLRFKARF